MDSKYWVDIGEHTHTIYRKLTENLFLCLHDEIIPANVGLVFEWNDIKKHVVKTSKNPFLKFDCFDSNTADRQVNQITLFRYDDFSRDGFTFIAGDKNRNPINDNFFRSHCGHILYMTQAYYIVNLDNDIKLFNISRNIFTTFSEELKLIIELSNSSTYYKARYEKSWEVNIVEPLFELTLL